MGGTPPHPSAGMWDPTRAAGVSKRKHSACVLFTPYATAVFAHPKHALAMVVAPAIVWPAMVGSSLQIEATQRPHIIRALESRRVCYRLLAHTASHLPDGGIFVFFHPLLEIIQDMHQAPDAIGEQR